MTVLFGLGFIAPLLLQTRIAATFAAPIDADPFWLAIGASGLWSAIACIRGRWL